MNFVNTVLAVVLPVVAGVSSYYSAISDIKVNYVRRDEVVDLSKKMERIGEDLAEIKGYLKAINKKQD